MVKKVTFLLAAGLIVLLILFEVRVDPQFALPQTIERTDDEQEARYRACVAERDRVIHAETFAKIDNPDVQREVLSTRKDQAAKECRNAFPERTVTADEPFRFNLVDLEFRF